MALDCTHIVETGKFTLTIDSTEVGHTEEGVEITIHHDNKEIFTHESGSIPVKIIHNGSDIRLKVTAVEIDANTLGWALPDATVSSNSVVTATISAGAVGDDLSASPFTITLASADGNKTLTFSNMIAVPEDITILSRVGEKWKLDLTFRQIYMESGNRFQMVINSY